MIRQLHIGFIIFEIGKSDKYVPSGIILIIYYDHEGNSLNKFQNVSSCLSHKINHNSTIKKYSLTFLVFKTDII